MRPLIPLMLLLTLAVAACGGGSSGGPAPTSAGTAFLTGEVVSVDGQSAGLAGVLLQVRETGEVVATDASGAFAIDDLPTGTVTIDVDAAAATAAALSMFVAAYGSGSGGSGDGGGSGGSGGSDDTGGSDNAGGSSDSGGSSDAGGPNDGGGPNDSGGAEHHDADGDGYCEEAHHRYQNGECFDDEEVEDGEDADDTDLTLHRVQARERIHLRLQICDGQIQSMECVREQNQERETERHMNQTGECDEPGMGGAVEAEMSQVRERLRVRVEGASYGRTLELWVDAPYGAQEKVGTMVVDADGEASLTLDAYAGDALPHGAGNLGELAGYRARVRDAGNGNALLEGDIPEVPPYRFGEDMGQGDLDRDRDQDQTNR